MKKDGFTGSEMSITDAHLGIHVLAEFYGCNSLINATSALEENMSALANKHGANIVNTNFHTFSPYGITGVMVIKESHISIHTWPEHSYAAIDVFSCTNSLSVDSFLDDLVELLEPSEHHVKSIRRGLLKNV